MIALRKYNKTIFVPEYIKRFIKNLIIACHASKTVPDPVNGKDFNKIENRSNKFLFENIGTRKKYRLTFNGKENSKGIHEGILMVRSKNKMIIGVEVFMSDNNNPPVKNIIVPELKAPF